MAKAFVQAYGQAVARTTFLFFIRSNSLCSDAGKGGKQAAQQAAQQVVRKKRMDRQQALDILNLSSTSPAVEDVLKVQSFIAFLLLEIMTAIRALL